MRIRSYLTFLTFLMILGVSICISGCSVPFLEANAPTLTHMNVGVEVVDPATDQPVPGVTVYLISCEPSNNDSAAGHLSNVTDSDGWAGFSVNYTIERGDTVYLGASTDKAMVDSDFALKSFDGAGRIGKWKAFGYDIVKNDQGEPEAYLTLAMRVDKGTGKLL